MNEARRVFKNTKRILLWLALLIVAVSLFTFEQTKGVTATDLRRMNQEFHEFAERYQEGAWNADTLRLLASTSIYSYKTNIDASIATVIGSMPNWLSAETVAEVERQFYVGGFGPDSNFNMAATAARQLLYLVEYPAYLDQIQRRADELIMFSIFADPDSFSYKNIQRTAADFRPLSGNTLVFANYNGWTAFYQFPYGDFLVLLAILAICLSFFEERKKGFSGILRTAYGGRWRLMGRRQVILASFCAIYGGIMELLLLLASGYLHHGLGSLFAPIQSIPMFEKSVLSISVGDCFVLFLILKMLAFFVVALAVWLLFVLGRQAGHSILLVALVFGFEFFTYRYIDVQSLFKGIKFFNLFSILDVTNAMTQYLNLNLFGYPVGLRMAQQAMLAFCFMTTFVALFMIAQNQYTVVEHGKLNRWFHQVAEWVSSRKKSTSALWYEFKKYLIGQRGACFILLFVLIHLYLLDTRAYYTPITDVVLNRLYQECEGMGLAQVRERADAFKEEMLQEEEEFLTRSRAFDSMELTYEDYLVAQLRYIAGTVRREAYAQFIKHVDYLSMLRETKGVEGKMVNPLGFTVWIGERSVQRVQRSYLILLVFLVLLVGSSFGYEGEMKMKALLHGTKRGGLLVHDRKLLAGGCVTATLFLVGAFFELYYVVVHYEIRGLGAAVQSLPEFYDFPIKCSILAFVLGMHIVRLFLFILAMVVVMYVSDRIRNVQAAMVVSALVVVIPSFLSYVGVAFVSFVSLLYYLCMVEAMDYGKRFLLFGMGVGGIMALSGVAFMQLRARWKKGW